MENIDKKICRNCKEEKEIGEYYKFHHDCKNCVSVRNKEEYEKIKDAKNARRREIYKKKQECKRLGIEYVPEKEVITEKKCRICEKTKDISEYNTGSAKCKDCQREYCKKWREDNEIELKKRKSEYYFENKYEIRRHQKEYRKKNKEYVLEQSKKRREKNKDKIKEWSKNSREKRFKNPQNRLNKNISNGIRKALNGNKKGKTWERLVGYTLDELKNHLESLWEPWMNWANYGNPNGDHTNCWHIDHIIPQNMFKYTSHEDEEFKLCWSLNNLQPKEGKANIIKGSRFIG